MISSGSKIMSLCGWKERGHAPQEIFFSKLQRAVLSVNWRSDYQINRSPKLLTMKLKQLTAVLLLLASVSLASAQALKPFTWDTYKMKFKISDDMNVAENNASKFEASNGNITMDI